ncbi:MAG: hypothetical protein GY856_02455 [bacterium]|nr:hypothetical protein [bacterium]
MSLSPYDRLLATLRLGRGRSFMVALYPPSTRRDAVYRKLVHLLAEQEFSVLMMDLSLSRQRDLPDAIDLAVAGGKRRPDVVVLYGLEDQSVEVREDFLRRSNFHRDALAEKNVSTVLLLTRTLWRWLANHAPDLARWVNGPIPLPAETEVDVEPGVLTQLHSRFEAARPAEPEEWVDLDELRGARPVERLVELVKQDPAAGAYGLVGPPGSGKSATLRRMAEALSDAGIASPVVAECLAEETDPSPSPADLLRKTVLRAFWSSAEPSGTEPPEDEPWIEARNLLQEIEGAPAAVLESRREHLRTLIDDLRTALDARGERPLFLLIDGSESLLDRTLPGSQNEELSRCVSELSPLVLTLPPSVLFSADETPLKYRLNLDYLPPVRVVDRDGRPNPAGVKAISELIRLRSGLELSELFASTADAERLAVLSAGNPGSVFRMLRNGLGKAEGLPLSRALIDRVGEEELVFLRRSLTPHDMEALAGVRQTHRADGVSAALLASGAVLAYQEGNDVWFAVHPALAEWLEARLGRRTEPLVLSDDGLPEDWIERLGKLWSGIREAHPDELRFMNDVFSDPEELARLYVEPGCQQVNPANLDEDAPGRAVREPIRDWLNEFLQGEVLRPDGGHTVFVLSDAGMGKSSLLMMLKLTHLAGFWPQELDFRLMKLGPETLAAIERISDHGRTVLLLDALDEDPTAWGRIRERLTDLLQATMGFRQVILTSRTQFFPQQGETPIERLGKIEVGGFVCHLLYLSPFGDAQVEAYLRKVYPGTWKDFFRKWVTGRENERLIRARQVIYPMKSLRMRPMLLARIDDLLDAEVREWREYRVYEDLVDHWLQREEEKLRKQKKELTKEQLWEACRVVAVHLQETRKRELTLADLDALLETQPAAKRIQSLDVGGRSLLNRTSEGGFRFCHYSIQEFLVAHHLIEQGGDVEEPLHATDQLVAFLLSWVSETPRKRLRRALWALTSGVRPSDVLYLEGVDLRGADLRGVDLHGVILRNADLRDVNAPGVSFQSADLRGAWLARGRFADADFEDARLRGVDVMEASFSGARGLTGELAALAGRPLHVVAKDQGSRSHVSLVAWEPNGACLASVSGDETMKIWDGQSGRLLQTLEGHTERVFSVAWDSSGSRLASGSKDKTVKIWDGRNGRLLHTLEGHTETVTSVAWESSGYRLASGAVDKTVKIWDVLSGRLLHTLEGHTEMVTSVAWDSGGSRLASGSEDETVKIWDTGSGRVLQTVKEHTRWAVVAWESNGPRLASGAYDGTVKIWDRKSGRLLHTLEGHTKRVVSVAWESSGYRLASGAHDRTVKIWDGGTGRLLHTLDHPKEVMDIAWEAEGGRLAVATAKDGTIDIWDLSGDKPQRLARLWDVPPLCGLVATADGYVDGPPSALEAVRIADGEVLYDLADLPDRHSPERVREALAGRVRGGRAGGGDRHRAPSQPRSITRYLLRADRHR